MRRRGLHVLTALAVLAAGRSARAQGAHIVMGTVYDSIAHAPLRGATVQMVAEGGGSRSVVATADSAGRYEMDNVPPGTYKATFYHPMLDSLGIEAPLRSVRVGDVGRMVLDLAIPGATHLRATICGITDTTSAMLLGMVRDAQSRAPLRNVSVVAGWTDMIITRDSTSLLPRRAVVKSAGSGWFALCELPAHAELLMVAVQGTDSSSVLGLTMPGEGVLRQDIYLSVGSREAKTSPMKGVVRAANDGHLIADARVAMAGSGETRTNARGEWTLSAPVGTRALEVRALGFYPDMRPVHVIDDAPVVTTRLSTLRQVLDTIKVVARSDDWIGFEKRRESGLGRFLDPKQVAALRPILATDVFLRMINVRTVKDRMGGQQIRMRGTIGFCVPAIFIDGAAMPEGVELNGYVAAREIRAVEVYDSMRNPSDYHDLNRMNCGTVLIWTKYAIH